MTRQEVLNLSALQIAEDIRSGARTPLEVVQAHINQIKLVNTNLNALIEDCFDQALLEAQQKTKVIEEILSLKSETERRKQLQDLKSKAPLFGVPFTVKEMFAVKGFKCTGGQYFAKDRRLDWTSTLAKRVFDQGAVMLGTTNVPELGFWFETENKVYGRTNNPYDKTRTCGGSSGGEGSIIGAGGSPFGLGSDIGGSIRIPAFFCGVFGHKPTHRVLPLTGQFPYSQAEIQNLSIENYPYTAGGFLTRKAEDLYHLLESTQGTDGIDPLTIKHQWLKPKLKTLQGLKVYTLADPHIHLVRQTDLELQNATMQSARYLEQMGASLHKLPENFFKNATEIWFAALQSTNMDDKNVFESKLSPDKKLNITFELAKSFRGKSKFTIPALLTAASERLKGKRSNNSRFEELMIEFQNLKNKLHKLLGEDAVLILPPISRVAPKHNGLKLTPFDFIQCGIFTVLETPATSIPTGLNDEGLPLGVQVVAAPFQDHLCLSVAEALESAFGGWTLPRGGL